MLLSSNHKYVLHCYLPPTMVKQRKKALVPFSSPEPAGTCMNETDGRYFYALISFVSHIAARRMQDTNQQYAPRTYQRQSTTTCTYPREAHVGDGGHSESEQC